MKNIFQFPEDTTEIIWGREEQFLKCLEAYSSAVCHSRTKEPSTALPWESRVWYNTAQTLVAEYFAVRTFSCCASHIPQDGKTGKRHSLGPKQKLNPSYFSITNIDRQTTWNKFLFLLMDQKTETFWSQELLRFQ